MDSTEPPHYRISRIAREMEEKGEEIVHMEIGDPDLDTDKRIIDAMYKAALVGYTHYGYSQGIPELREAIADYLNSRLSTNFDKDNICLTPGGKVAIYLALRLLKKNVIGLLEPIWGLYHSFSQVLDLKLIHVRSEFEDFWIPRDDELMKLNDAEIISIVNPSNPTGTILPETTVEKIVDIAKSNRSYIVADELYFDLLFDGARFTSFLEFDYENTLSIFSFSKSFAMTGFRVGYVVSPSKELIKRFSKFMRLIIGGVPPFIQYAALEAMNNKDIIENNRRFYQEHTLYLMEELLKLGFKVVKPQAGIYLFPRVPENLDGIEFVEKLLKIGKVAVSPGTGFGDYPDFVRFTTALKKEKLDLAIDRIKFTLDSINS